MNDEDVHRGSRIYSRSVLRIYDLFVIRLSNSFAWQCQSNLMLEQYDRLLGARHLDVGPGTGWFLAHAQLPEDVQITLLDLNANSLSSASSRLDGIGVTHHGMVANVLDPLPEKVGPFDSIAVNYVFHCVPGTWEEKGEAFGHLADQLTDDGVLFGSTILGRGVDHNLGGRKLMALYNRIGVFHNRDDDAAGLRSALLNSFEDVTIDIIGVVAVFSARRPRRSHPR